MLNLNRVGILISSLALIFLGHFGSSLSGLSQALGASPVKLDPAFGKAVAECSSPASKTSKQHVWFFEQWHLAPDVVTKDTENFVEPPQTKNQVAIYQQLDQWITAGQLRTIYAEGCMGEISHGSKLKFNGWTLPDLEKIAKYPDYVRVMTSIPLKLEAKHGKNLSTLCGDDESLIKESNLAFSDARGTLGFILRLEQYRNDPTRAKNYLDGVVERFKLPKTTTVDQAIHMLKTELKSAVARAQAGLEKRNQSLVQTIAKTLSKSKDTDIAVIFGGLHAAGVLKLLEEKGLGCTVVEPVGYPTDGKGTDAELMKSLNEALAKL
ncbi:MAG: hypothetical protein H7222_18410 [Methylotenera sp.]|nr:hypothetical protein [Oligoflexia bacterium]